METDSGKWVEWHPPEDDPLSPFIIKRVKQKTHMRDEQKRDNDNGKRYVGL